MAFLDNSGDIILDAVLTDTGRKRLAKGDGSFKIDKFALADDEIDYALYENGHTGATVAAAHASGGSYYDLNIMMTPILEAFTNNASSMKSKLISLTRDDLWFLPEMVLHTTKTAWTQYASTSLHVIAVDQNTVEQWTNSGNTELEQGVLNAKSPGDSVNGIRVEQGINNDAKFGEDIDHGLRETQYIIEMDNRFGVLTNTDGTEKAVSYIDDDNIASYYVSSASDNNMVKTDENTPSADEKSGIKTNQWDLKGARGSRLELKVRSSISLSTSETLFAELGATKAAAAPDSTDYLYIDTSIRITGATTGASIDIPVRYVKKPA